MINYDDTILTFCHITYNEIYDDFEIYDEIWWHYNDIMSPADVSWQRHDQPLGHPPHTLDNNEVSVGQVRRAVLSEKM